MRQNKQPVIGICMSLDTSGLIRTGVSYSFIRREYGEQVRASGGQPVFMENTIDPEVATELCDGIIISGGEDINPAFYGQTPISERVQEPADRTEWEQKLIDACDRTGTHILGVCYGMQLLNIHYGGTLFQDVGVEQGTTMDHGSSAGSAMQRIRFTEDFLSFSNQDSVETAHRHHQAVRDIAPGFTIAASADDGIVEAISGHGHYGIQWHAESDGTADAIYTAFIALCADQPAGARALALSPKAL